MITIGVSGCARVGKNTLCELIIEELDLESEEYKMVAVADPIKNIVCNMFPGLDKKCLFGASELRSNTINPTKYKDAEGNPLTYRQATIDIGKLGRLYSDDLWLNLLAEDAKTSTGIHLYMVPDCRFINELYYLKNNGFYMIRVLRDGCPQIDDISETQQKQVPDSFFDKVIHNDGNIDDLRLKVRDMIKDFYK